MRAWAEGDLNQLTRSDGVLASLLPNEDENDELFMRRSGSSSVSILLFGTSQGGSKEGHSPERGFSDQRRELGAGGSSGELGVMPYIACA